MMIPTALPGFIDLQVNGYLGIDFSSPDLTPDSFTYACVSLFNAGTVAFLPTVITSPLEVYERNLPIIAEFISQNKFEGRLLGIHLEGPFISPEVGAVGAHRPEFVREPDVNTFQQINAWANHTIRILTLAAERKGAEELASYASQQGIVVSSGHSLATGQDLHNIASSGAIALTHLGNGLPHTLHKYNNPLWAGLAEDRLTAMMIGDGHHIPDGVLKAMIRSKGVKNTIIVSDAASVAGLPPGRYATLGNEVVLEESGLLHNPQKGYLVGSSATMCQCMNHLAHMNVFSLSDLLDLGYHNPLRLLGISEPSFPAQKQMYYDDYTKTFKLSS